MAVKRASYEPWLKDEIEYYKHQGEGIARMLKMRNALLADDMGLGKSLQALTVFAVSIIQQDARKLLIVCPATLKRNWARELTTFTRIPHVVMDGTPEQRERQFKAFREIDGPKALIMNYESVEGFRESLNQEWFDFAIFDEAHYLKNPSSIRTKAGRSIEAQRKFLLTGSPLLNHVNDLWSLLDMISPGDWGSYHKFKSRYCKMGGFKGKSVVGVKNEHELIGKVQDVMIRRLKEDVTDLPEVQYIERHVGLSNGQRKLYDKAYNEMKLDVGGGGEEEIKNAAVRFLRCRQICGTTATVQEGLDESLKLEAAIDEGVQVVDRGGHLIVFTQFRAVQASYVRRFQNATKALAKQRKGGVPVYILNGSVKANDRQGVVDEWTAGPPGVIVCMYQVAGVGLNMTKASTLHRLDLLPVPLLNKQAVDRAHRIGMDKTKPVQVVDFICEKTVEHRIQKILKLKTKVNNTVIDIDADTRSLMLQVLEAERKNEEY